MKKPAKILTVLLLSFLLSALALTGCGKKPEEDPSQSYIQTSEGDTTESEAPSQGSTETSGTPKQAETLGAVAIVENAGYEYYNFVRSTADKYIEIVNSAAEKLSGKAQVISFIIPTSMDIMLDEATRSTLNTSDQKKAIDYFYGSMREDIKTVNAYDTLLEHNNEYIYYRTDHHWTALGAYYGYTKLSEAAGVKALPLDKFEKVSYGEFLGSFYADTKQSEKLKKNADELEAFKPYYSTSLTYTDTKGNEIKWPLVNDVTNYKSAYKYSAFAAGDNPFTVVENKDMTEGKTCLVIKESFANALIPYLAGNYKTLYEIDYRYWKGNISDFVSKNNVDDVMIINNISATRNASLVGKLENII